MPCKMFIQNTCIIDNGINFAISIFETNIMSN